MSDKILIASSRTYMNTGAEQTSKSSAGAMERPQLSPLVRCPRCDSANTKFCYYNNYSLSQPRHFCKACKRYWTRGGTLRNIPVGGRCRKNKRVKKLPQHLPPSENLKLQPAPKPRSFNFNYPLASTATPISSTSVSDEMLKLERYNSLMMELQGIGDFGLIVSSGLGQNLVVNSIQYDNDLKSNSAAAEKIGSVQNFADSATANCWIDAANRSWSSSSARLL
ncbi:dof zinc finger protein DOF3.2-like [Zingiber officinale]|uniref:Dof zinc finger protein n=1 Tax=Zingiber officinale TaxID=94328 RepID=A0A8J5I5C4_ZINOF|nr:dof zinc finger protein DOF3.2-like [Zingiber officinale]KAG6537486.1 hypothetical protein ZIOFF_002580 [Zingiber officinale]